MTTIISDLKNRFFLNMKTILSLHTHNTDDTDNSKVCSLIKYTNYENKIELLRKLKLKINK